MLPRRVAAHSTTARHAAPCNSLCAPCPQPRVPGLRPYTVGSLQRRMQLSAAQVDVSVSPATSSDSSRCTPGKATESSTTASPAPGAAPNSLGSSSGTARAAAGSAGVHDANQAASLPRVVPGVALPSTSISATADFTAATSSEEAAAPVSTASSSSSSSSISSAGTAWKATPPATTAAAAAAAAGPGGTTGVVLTRGTAPAAADASSPSLVDRAVAACVFLLPVTEGIYRLALVATATCRHNALDLLMWAQVHGASLSSSMAAAGKAGAASKLAEELQACNMMAVWSSAIYARLTQVLQQLLSFSQAPPLQLDFSFLRLPAALPLPHPGALPHGPEIGHWLSVTFGTPVALWSLAGLGLLAVLMQYAQQLLDEREARGRGSSSMSSVSSMSSSEEEDSAAQQQLFRRPDMVLLACTCAVLLRVAWVPLTSLSGLALSVYGPLSIMLTLAATYFSTAAFFRMWWVQLPGASLREGMGDIAEGLLGVVLWHRTLVLLDWMLSAFSSSTFAAKVQLAGAFLVYSLAVEYLSKLIAYSLDAKRRDTRRGSGSSKRGGGGGGGGLWVGAPPQPSKGAVGT